MLLVLQKNLFSVNIFYYFYLKLSKDSVDEKITWNGQNPIVVNWVFNAKKEYSKC